MTAADAAVWFPLIALIATFPVYALRVRGRPLDADVARRNASVLLGYRLRDWMIWVVSPLERRLVRKGVSPVFLNYLGAGLGLLAGAAFIARELPIAAWLIALGGISDVLDGRIARTRGVASAYGHFLDSMSDRFGETFTYLGVAWYLAGSAWMAAATALLIGGSLLVSYTRVQGAALGVVFTGGLAQRAERLVLLALAALLDPTLTWRFGWSPGRLLAGAVVVIAVGSIATAVYRTVFIARILAARLPDDPSSSEAPARDVEPARGTGIAAQG